MAFESLLSLVTPPAVHAKPDVVRVNPEGQNKQEKRGQSKHERHEGERRPPLSKVQDDGKEAKGYGCNRSEGCKCHSHGHHRPLERSRYDPVKDNVATSGEYTRDPPRCVKQCFEARFFLLSSSHELDVFTVAGKNTFLTQAAL